MSNSGKKGKKPKGTVISLQSFLADEGVPSGITQVAKKLRNVDGDESDGDDNALPQIYQLPTGPKANRAFIDESVPYEPPFMAFISNLPFDVNEDDIRGLFGNMSLISIRLPKDDGETGRVRGFCYAEFEDRQSLVRALTLPDPSIKGRKIRIELANENESYSNRPKSYRRGYLGSSNMNDERESSNWRQNSSGPSQNFERGFNRDVGDVHENQLEPVSWRTRISTNENNVEKTLDHRGTSKLNMTKSREFCSDELSCARPKLVLMPRTMPLPKIKLKIDSEEEPESNNLASLKKPFGSARPVDTAAKEKEIEGRLEEARRRDRYHEKTQAEVTETFSKIQLQKIEKETTNVVVSWRCKNDINLHQARTLPHSTEKKELEDERDDHKITKELGGKLAKPKKKCDEGANHFTDSEVAKQSTNKYFGLHNEDSD